MSHQIVWTVPDHVIMVELSGGIDAEEAQAVANEVYLLIDASPSPVINFLVHSVEAAIDDKIWNYSKLKLRRHPKVNLVIIIGDSRIYGLIVAIIAKLVNIHIQYSDSADAALKIISGFDPVVAAHINKSEDPG